MNIYGDKESDQRNELKDMKILLEKLNKKIDTQNMLILIYFILLIICIGAIQI